MDYSRILNGNMLSDIDINVAQELIKKQFVNMPGLQNVLLGATLTYEVVSHEMIQIINNGAFHWLMLSTVGCEDGHINVFDSMATRSELPMHVQMQIASLLACTFKQVHFHYQACQQQTGGVDCDLFAIAFAIDICLGSKVDSMTYKQSSMRQHLFQCLRSGKFTSFPRAELEKRLRRCKAVTMSFNVFCYCRLPDNEVEKMIKCSQCKEWYHVSCAKVKLAKSSPTWLCSKCLVV